MKINIKIIWLWSCLLAACQWGTLEDVGSKTSQVQTGEENTSIAGQWPENKQNFRTEAGKIADRLAKELEEEQKNTMSRKEIMELAASRPLVITNPKPVEKVDLQSEKLPELVKPKVSEKKFNKSPRDVKRSLPKNIKELMRAIEVNEMIKAERLLKVIKSDIAAGRVTKADQFLVKNLESYIYHRLGEDKEVLKIAQENLEYLQDVLTIDIKHITPVDPKRPINHGEYTKIANPVYGRGQVMHVYMELTNYTQKKVEDNKYSISLKADLTLKDSLGQFVHEMNHKVGKNNVSLEKIYNDALRKNTCRLKRSLIYQYFKIPIPTNINPGHYEMEIEIIDLHDDQKRSDKKSVSFKVK